MIELNEEEKALIYLLCLQARRNLEMNMYTKFSPKTSEQEQRLLKTMKMLIEIQGKLK